MSQYYVWRLFISQSAQSDDIGEDCAGMQRISIALQHSSVRIITFWTVGLLAVVALFEHLTTCARNGLETLGGLSWLVEILIMCGRTVGDFFMADGWFVVAAIVSLAITSMIVMSRGPELRAEVAGTWAAALSLASALLMAEQYYGIAVGLAVGAGAVIVACGPRREQLRATAQAWPLVVPLGVGALLRLWSLAQYPRGFAEHAVVHLAEPLRLGERLIPSLLALDMRWATQLFSMLKLQQGPMSMVDGLGFSIFGVGMVEARLTQAVLGCLAICMAYALGASVDGPRLGFLFSFFLAVSPWHIAFSRYGDAEHVLPTLQVLLALYFVYRAARHGRTRDYILAGITVALSWYVYATNQIVPLLAALFFLYKLVASRGLLRRDGRKLIYMIAVFTVFSIPHFSTRLDDGGLWPVRTSPEKFNPEALSDLRTTEEAVQQLYSRVQDAWFFRPGGGLGVAVQSLLIVGAVCCLAGIFVPKRRDSSVLLLLWLALSFLPAILCHDVYFRRLLLTLVVALILSSIAILRILDLLEEGGVSKRATSLILTGLCAFGAAVGAYVYFEEVRVAECNVHINHTDIADYVSGNFGEAFIYVIALNEEDRLTIEGYIQLFAYERIRGLRQQGKDKSDFVSVVTPATLFSALTELRSFDNRTCFVSRRDAERERGALTMLCSRMAPQDCIVRESGELVIWECEGTIDPRDSHEANLHFSPAFVARAARCRAQWGLRPEGRGARTCSTSSTPRRANTAGRGASAAAAGSW